MKKFMTMPCKMRKIFLLPDSTSALVGVYADDDSLEQILKITPPLSDGLVPKFMELQENGIEFDTLYFVRGPGSFMALKLIYLFAKTLEIAKGVKLYAAHAFNFNHNTPIKAYGNCYFVQEHQKSHAKDYGIVVKRFEGIPLMHPCVLPQTLDKSVFSTTLQPLYLLPPV